MAYGFRGPTKRAQARCDLLHAAKKAERAGADPRNLPFPGFHNLGVF